MKYDYLCNKCNHTFMVSHGMMEKPEVKCERCGSKNTQRTFIAAPEFYTRGYGYCDKKGARRDMNLHKLVNDDPYASMRQPGEKEDLAQKLRQGGKHNPRRKIIVPKMKR
jgi:putative FmdB family regulatory protein